MADLSRTIQIVFEAVDNTGTGIAALGKGVGDLAGNLEAATEPFANLSKAILAFDALVVGLAATLGSAAIDEARAFEVSMAGVAKQAGDTAKPLGEMATEIETVGAAFGVNANDVAAATADFMAAGYDYATAADLVKTSTALMIAGDLDAKTATDAISDSLAGFKVKAEDAAPEAQHIGDLLNKMGDISSKGVSEIAEGFAKLAPTAKDAGWSMEQTAAAIAVITDTGIPASEAANALKSGLVSLLGPSGEAAAKLEDLGVKILDSNGKHRAAGDIMADLAVKYGELEQSEKLHTAEVIFGKDQVGKLNALLGDWGKSQKYVAAALDETTGATGSMAKEVEIKLATLDSKIKTTDEIWRQFLVHLGDKIVGGGDYESLIVGLGKLGEALKGVIDDGDLDPLIKPFQDAFATIGKLFEDMAENLPEALEQIDWGRFNDAMKDLTGSVNGIFDGIDLSTPEGLAKVIQDILDVGAGLIKTTSGIVDGLKPLFEIVGGLFKAFSELDPEVQKAIGYFLGMSTTVNVLSGYVKTFSDIFGDIGSITGAGLLAKLKSLGSLAAAVAVAFAAFEIGKWIAEFTGLDKALDGWVESLNGVPDAAKPAAAAVEGADAKLKALGITTDTAGKRLTDFNEAVKSGALVWDDVTQAWVKAGDASEVMIKAQTGILGVTTDLEPALLDLYDTMGLNADGTKKLADATKDGKTSHEEYKASLEALDKQFAAGDISLAEYTEGVEAIHKAAGDSVPAIDKLTKAEEDAAKKTKDLAAESEKFALEWGKLLSAERIAVFEASADIQVAQIEADSKRAVAAMEMLGASFQNTGDVLTELIGLWVGLEGMDQSKIEGWIEREYAIREKLAQAQIDMVNAEIRRMEAQTALLERGGIELNINSDGLEEGVKQFMFQILDKIRVSVAGSYEEFLLGCGG